MSIDSWKAEFYPTEAITTQSDEAVQHTLQKWKGARHENLAKHDLEKIQGYTRIDSLIVKERFTFGSTSCALCQHYDCLHCPLYKHTSCDCGHTDSKYHQWIHENDPEPMITALEEILAKEQS